jgi:uncharacterized protein (TIGR02996 family)
MRPLLDLILSKPDNKEAWQVLADWYGSNGDPIRAQLIVDQLRLSSLPPKEARRVRAQIRFTLAHHGARWREELPKFKQLHWACFSYSLPKRVIINELKQLPKLSKQLGELAPVRQVSCTGNVEGTEAVEIPWLESLSIQESYDQLDHMEDFLKLPFVRNLKRLDLTGAAIGNEGAEQIASCPFSRLNVLKLNGNYIGSSGLAALCNAPALARLTRLELGGYGYGSYSDDPVITESGIQALVDSPLAASLHCLSLYGNQIDAVGLELLLKHLPVLKKLVIYSNDLNGLKLSFHSNTRLESLLIQRCNLNAADLHHLLSHPSCHELKELELGTNNIGTDLSGLISAPCFSKLEKLSLAGISFEKKAMEQLADAPSIPAELSLKDAKLAGCGPLLADASWWSQLNALYLGGVNDQRLYKVFSKHSFPELEILDLQSQTHYGYSREPKPSFQVVELPDAPQLFQLSSGEHPVLRLETLGTTLLELQIPELSLAVAEQLSKSPCWNSLVFFSVKKADFTALEKLKPSPQLRAFHSTGLPVKALSWLKTNARNLEMLNMTMTGKLSAEQVKELKNKRSWPRLQFVSFSVGYQDNQVYKVLNNSFPQTGQWPGIANEGLDSPSETLYMDDDTPF